jgi:hypothetical protein
MTGAVNQIVILKTEAAKLGRRAVWTVFAWRRDYPTGYVARMFEVTSAGPEPTDKTLKSMELDSIREKLTRAGLVCMMREERDEPDIIERWV